MTGGRFQTNLGPWENEPVVQDEVIAYMDSIGAPMLLREIYRPLGLPRGTVNRVLARLHKKGVLTRYKIPVRLHRPGLRGESALADTAARSCFLYSFTSETVS